MVGADEVPDVVVVVVTVETRVRMIVVVLADGVDGAGLAAMLSGAQPSRAPERPGLPDCADTLLLPSGRAMPLSGATTRPFASAWNQVARHGSRGEPPEYTLR